MDDEGWRYEACGYEGSRREGMILSCLGVMLTDRQTDICDCIVAFATEKERLSIKDPFDMILLSTV